MEIREEEGLALLTRVWVILFISLERRRKGAYLRDPLFSPSSPDLIEYAEADGLLPLLV